MKLHPLMLALLNTVGTTQVFTCNHHFSSCSAVVGMTRGLSCHFGEGLGTDSWSGWHSDTTVVDHHNSNDSTNKSTVSHFSQLQFDLAFWEAEREAHWEGVTLLSSGV